MHDLFVMEAEAHGFTLEDLSEGHYLIRTPVGFVEYFIEEAPVRLRLSSSDHKTLYYLKESIDADLMEADLVPEWAGNMPLSFRPPNFSTATVVSKTWINDVFMRV
ncbi:hypothetical protein [uncultured Cohaesibacter sp.]|uniref:hypothetical protein n=1 Tax=uncultured Cohaesibacter sp. TaxID=1002546 RepID=UPI0029C7FCC0|nr:hypothetical protein [uncultured Cohaesibacter sp.]